MLQRLVNKLYTFTKLSKYWCNVTKIPFSLHKKDNEHFEVGNNKKCGNNGGK